MGETNSLIMVNVFLVPQRSIFTVQRRRVHVPSYTHIHAFFSLRPQLTDFLNCQTRQY